jgi:hypothetical protein
MKTDTIDEKVHLEPLDSYERTVEELITTGNIMAKELKRFKTWLGGPSPEVDAWEALIEELKPQQKETME